MTRMPLALGIFAVLLLAFVVAFLPSRPSPAPESAAGPMPGAARATEKPAVARDPARPEAIDLPDAGLAVQDAVSALRPLAESGRADAMSRMALHLLNCSHWASASEERFREVEVSRFRGASGHEPGTEADITTIATAVEKDVAYQRACADIDPALMHDRLDWLEKAALAGDPRARIEYVNWGLQDMPGREDILLDFDEVQRRRALAGDFLLQALSAGDCRALAPLAQAYSGLAGTFDWIVAKNAVKAYAYGMAAIGKGDPAPDVRARLEGLIAGFESMLTPAQKEQANRMVRSFGSCRQ